MIQINQKKIDIIAQIATQIVTDQTTEELTAILNHAGKMYDEGTLAAEIAVKLLLRILGIEVQTRAVSPVDALVDRAQAHYDVNYAG